MLFIAALTGSLLGGLIVSGSILFVMTKEQRKRTLHDQKAWKDFIDVLKQNLDKG